MRFNRIPNFKPIRIPVFASLLIILSMYGPILKSESADFDVALTPVEDTFISDREPSSSFGSNASLGLGYSDEFGSQRILLRFDLADQLSENGLILEAELQLYVEAADPAFDPPLAIDVHRVTEGWNETITNWNNRPDISGVVTSGAIERDINFHRVDITDLVRDWQLGNETNYGLMIIADANVSNQRYRSIASREAQTVFQPRLTISFSDDDTGPSASLEPLPAYSNVNFTVKWSGEDNAGGSGLKHYDLQVSVNRGEWEDWLLETTDTEAEYNGTAGNFYQFRVRGVDLAGNAADYSPPQAETLVGIPFATIQEINATTISGSQIPLAWTLEEFGGGTITGVEIYQSFNGGPWEAVLSGVTGTSLLYTPTNGDGIYAFEALAQNVNGIREPLQSRAEATVLYDGQAPFIQPSQYMPLFHRQP